MLCGLTQRFSSPEYGKEQFAELLLTKDPKIFMLGFALKDEPNKGLSFYSKHPCNVHPSQASRSRPRALRLGPQSPHLPRRPSSAQACSPSPLTPSCS